MWTAEQLETRRTLYYVLMLIALVTFLALIFVEVFRPGWACGMLGLPGAIMGGNPFLAAATAAALVVAVLMAVTESRIDHAGLRDVLDDERRLLHKLKAWRNAYFGAVLGLFVFVLLSDSSSAIDMPFVLGGVMVSGAIALYATMLYLDRD